MPADNKETLLLIFDVSNSSQCYGKSTM